MVEVKTPTLGVSTDKTVDYVIMAAVILGVAGVAYLAYKIVKGGFSLASLLHLPTFTWPSFTLPNLALPTPAPTVATPAQIGNALAKASFNSPQTVGVALYGSADINANGDNSKTFGVPLASQEVVLTSLGGETLLSSPGILTDVTPVNGYGGTAGGKI
jgi:hypothetical protein